MLNNQGQTARASQALIAPLWHTLLVAFAVLSVSFFGLRIRAHTAALASHHVREYLFTLAWEWTLAAAVLWGVSLNHTPARALLGEWPRGGKAWLADAGVALVFWLISACVLGAAATLLRLAHLRSCARQPGRTAALSCALYLGRLL